MASVSITTSESRYGARPKMNWDKKSENDSCASKNLAFLEQSECGDDDDDDGEIHSDCSTLNLSDLFLDSSDDTNNDTDTDDNHSECSLLELTDISYGCEEDLTGEDSRMSMTMIDASSYRPGAGFGKVLEELLEHDVEFEWEQRILAVETSLKDALAENNNLKVAQKAMEADLQDTRAKNCALKAEQERLEQQLAAAVKAALAASAPSAAASEVNLLEQQQQKQQQRETEHKAELTATRKMYDGRLFTAKSDFKDQVAKLKADFQVQQDKRENELKAELKATRKIYDGRLIKARADLEEEASKARADFQSLLQAEKVLNEETLAIVEAKCIALLQESKRLRDGIVELKTAEEAKAKADALQSNKVQELLHALGDLSNGPTTNRVDDYIKKITSVFTSVFSVINAEHYCSPSALEPLLLFLEGSMKRIQEKDAFVYGMTVTWLFHRIENVKKSSSSTSDHAKKLVLGQRRSRCCTAGLNVGDLLHDLRQALNERHKLSAPPTQA